jgi:hypothetical protein
MVEVAAQRVIHGDVPETHQERLELFDEYEVIFGVWYEDTEQEIACAMLLKGRDVSLSAANKVTALPCMGQENAELYRFLYGDGPPTVH